MTELTPVASILLGTDFEQFQGASVLLDRDRTAFEAQGFVDQFDLRGWWNEPGVDQALLLYGVASTRRRLLTLDWTGEDDPGDLQNFVVETLRARGVDVELTPITDWEAGIDDWSNYERGDFIIEKMKRVDAQLQKSGFRLAFLDMGWDAYCVFVVSGSDLGRIDGAELTSDVSVHGVDRL